jgi:uncharacterized protein YndB with AHSA1/START domain
LTLTLIGDYPVPVERLWEAWADPRQLERFWGPPGWPATFTRHDLAVGGRSEYVMSGPDGERSAGYWVVEAIDPFRFMEVLDGFANEDGSANEQMPNMRMRMSFEATPTGSRLVSVTTFPDLATMEQLVEMGMVEGATAAFGQMDDVLADLASFAASIGTTTMRLTDTKVRVTRPIRGSVDQVWRAFRDPELIRQWMLGPDGWTMPVCEETDQVGGTYRHEWESAETGERFGFEGTVLELSAPYLIVVDQRPIGMPAGSGIRIESTFSPVAGGTLLTAVMTAPDAALLDEILATGMVDGMETSYARLEHVVLQSA